MPSIFTRIITGDIPCYKIAETESGFAFLDINPLSKGHTLVIPKQEVDQLFDVKDEQYLELMLFAKKIGKAIKKVVPCKRIGVTVIGLEVPHAHVHLIPINALHDMEFSKGKIEMSSAELIDLADKIAAEVKL